MREASFESRMIVARKRADRVSDHSRSWPTMAGLLGRPLDAVLSLEKTRRTLEKTCRSASTRAFRIAHRQRAHPPPCAHDAHLVGRSERCTDGARARPIHAPARAPSARRGRVSAHLESSPRRARIRAPSSRRDRLRPQSAPLRACNGAGRASSLRRAQKPSGPMTQLEVSAPDN